MTKIIQKTQKREKETCVLGYDTSYTYYILDSGIFKTMNYFQKHNYEYGKNIKKY